ncbi:hypothetical protein [Bradyrhizobium archetypum]|uniref:hypothetical protein n=1 Tax=Bradyrhizobium archetypum TaxID=2721160 RepID=UPI00289BF04F|nr:hypothetical protein [Bradyrhizobium archetypum]
MESAFDDHPWVAGRTIRGRCAVGWIAICKSSGFLCSFRAGLFMRSRWSDKFDTGDGLDFLPQDPSILMQILRRIALVLIWLAGVIFVFAAANKNDPYLISLRGPGNIVLVAASIVAAAILLRYGYWRRGVAGSALVLLWCLPLLSMLCAHASFEWRKHRVLQAMPGRCEPSVGILSSDTRHSPR